MKNILIGASMLVLAFYLLWEQGKQQQELMGDRVVADENPNKISGESSRTFSELNSSFQNPTTDQNLSQTYLPFIPYRNREKRRVVRRVDQRIFYSRIY